MEPTQPSQVPTTPPQQFPQPAMPASTSRGWKMPTAIIVGVLIIAGGVYAWMQRTPATPVAELTPTPTPDPTADWKTYTNTQYGFELRYPNSWDVNQPTDIFPDVTLINTGRSFEKTEAYPAYNPAVYISRAEDKYSGSIIQYEKTLNASVRGLRKQETVTIGGKAAYVYEGVTPPTAHNFRVVFANNSVYTITSNDPMIEADRGLAQAMEAKSDFLQILSTLKFIEPTAAVPADWKTYTNTQYGFAFKYPAQWPSPASYTVGFTGAAESFLGQSKWGYEFGIKKDIEGSLSSSYYMGAYPASDRSIILQKLKSSEQYKGGLVTIKDATLTIGGFPAIRYDEGGLCGYPSAMIFTPRYTLKIVSNCNNESSDPFDQILSTFKFIEPTAAVPADWKTYTNTKYGFEFRYPAAWVTTQHSGNGLLQIFALPKESQNTDRNDGVNLGIMSQKQFGDNYSEATVSGKPANAIAGFTTYEFIHQGQIGAPSKISYFVFQNNYFVFSRNTTNAEAEQSIFTFRFSK